MIRLLTACALAAGAAAAQDVSLKPFTLDWKDNLRPLAGASRLLEAPAGKRGFVGVAGGRLVYGGKRFRIWGINITAAANEPSKPDAANVAAYLARFGINCVRMHFLDRTAPTGLIDAARPDTRSFDTGQLDRLDFFIAQLKRRGIYVNLNLNVGRTYKAGDGVRDFELIGFAKALTYFDERLLELQREYARALLTHRNPYTGNEYRNEPAVALVELVNENLIVESWVSNRLLGKAARKNPGTWADIPASYEQALTAKYQAWLKARGLAPAPRLRKEEFAKAEPARFRNEAAFYVELEDRYFQSMYSLLKKEIGVKAPVLATSDHNHGISGYPLLASASKLDVVDGHIYWQHPKYLEDAGGRRKGFTIGNTAMVDEPLRSTVVQLSRSAVEGKPYIVSEVNHPFPAEYACEGIPILAAYAAFQDWDGIFWYTFEHSDPAKWRAKQPGHFELRSDPVKMTQIAAGAYVFLAGGVAAAKETATRGYSHEQVLDGLRAPWSEGPYFTPGFPLHLPLVNGSRIASFERAGTPAAAAARPAEAIVSDTGQLSWWGKPGMVTVDAPRAQALVGRIPVRAQSTRHLAAKIENAFAALTLVPLDGRDIAKSRRMLLSTGSRTANTGMEWNSARTSLVDWGTEPTLIEPVTGTVTLKGLMRAGKVEVQPLDGAGKALGPPAAVRKAEAGWEVSVGAPATPWHLVTVR